MNTAPKRNEMREERQAAVTAALRQHMVDAPVFSAKTCSSDELKVDVLAKVVAGDKALDLARLGAVYEQAERLDADAALDMVEDVLRAAGIAVTLVPDRMLVTEAAGLVSLVAEAGAAEGEKNAAVLRAASDGAIDPEEDAGVKRLSRRSRRLDLAIEHSVSRMAERVQPRLQGVA